ncbi:MAG: hypothetical protein ACKV0T_07610 [Planctomycetales bacterium]
MSRTRKGKSRSASVADSRSVAGGRTAEETQDAAGSVKPHPLLLKLSIVAAVVWTITLAVMGWTTANPLALSIDQIRQADAVVVGRLAEGTPPRLHIEQVLSGPLQVDDEPPVLNLPEASGIDAEGSYVVPLSRYRQGFRITLLDGQMAPPLVYRATPETLDRVRRLLK